jgi:hypothetical protein
LNFADHQPRHNDRAATQRFELDVEIVLGEEVLILGDEV